MSDKTEEPTPRKLAKAREQGDVGASAFASQSLGFLVAALLVPSAVVAASSAAAGSLRTIIAEQGTHFSAQALALEVTTLVLPLLGAVALASAVATFVQTGGLFAPATLKIKLERLNPIAGLKNLFSKQRLWAVGRALFTSAFVLWLAYAALRLYAPDLAACTGRPETAAFVAGSVISGLARKAALLGLAMGALDWLVSRRAWLSKLRMTKAEVKQEYKESEGDPQTKAARERARMEMLHAATLSAVKEATVIIVNPQHLATALRYVDGEDEAPKVVANGEGDLAKRIQEAARAWGIPIVRDVPVARALRELEPGDEIPEALYEAVAEILREVWDAEDAELEANQPPGPSAPPASK